MIEHIIFMRLAYREQRRKDLMKIKKSIWIASIIILLSLFGGLYYYTQGQSLEYSKLMNQIEKRTYHQVEIEQVLYESVMERIEHKLNQG